MLLKLELKRQTVALEMNIMTSSLDWAYYRTGNTHHPVSYVIPAKRGSSSQTQGPQTFKSQMAPICGDVNTAVRSVNAAPVEIPGLTLIILLAQTTMAVKPQQHGLCKPTQSPGYTCSWGDRTDSHILWIRLRGRRQHDTSWPLGYTTTILNLFSVLWVLSLMPNSFLLCEAQLH